MAQTDNYVQKYVTSGGPLTDSLIYDDGAKVGIGTTGPAAKLDVISSAFPIFAFTRTGSDTNTARGVGQFILQSSTDVTDGFGPLIRFDLADTGTAGGNTGYLGDIGAVRDGADNVGSLVFRTTLAGAAAEVVRIKGDSVGIGTTNPVAALTLGAGKSFAAVLPTPNAPTGTAVNAGGSLAGTFYYKIVAETFGSSPAKTSAAGTESAAITVSSPNNAVSLSWAPVPGAFSYRLYRGTSPGGEDEYVLTGLTNCVDDGSGWVPGTPPTAADGSLLRLGPDTQFGSFPPRFGDLSAWEASFIKIGQNMGAPQHTVNIQTTVPGDTKSTSGYENAALLVQATTYDPSAADGSYLRDLVGLDARSMIGSGNPLGRVWAMYLAAQIEPSVESTDGALAGAEIAILNYGGTDQKDPVVNAGLGKTGLFLVADGQPCTSAIRVAGNIPAPTGVSAPTLSDGGSGGHLAAGTYEGKVSFVTFGVETQPTAASGSLTISANHKISWTNIPLGPSGVTFSRKLYRKNPGSQIFRFVTEITNNTTTSYTDDADVQASQPKEARWHKLLYTDSGSLGNEDSDSFLEIRDWFVVKRYDSPPAGPTKTMEIRAGTSADNGLLLNASKDSTGRIDFQTHDTLRMRLEPTGRLLIGLSSTDISGCSLVTNACITIATASSNASLASLACVAGSYVSLTAARSGTGSHLPLALFTGGAERLRVQTNGNVSVGSASDLGHKFEVTANGALRFAIDDTNSMSLTSLYVYHNGSLKQVQTYVDGSGRNILYVA